MQEEEQQWGEGVARRHFMRTSPSYRRSSRFARYPTAEVEENAVGHLLSGSRSMQSGILNQRDLGTLQRSSSVCST